MASSYNPKLAKQRRRRSPALLPAGLVIGIFLVAALAILIWMAIKILPYRDYDRILPNVYIGDVNVGGMTEDEALEAVSGAFASELSSSVTVTLPDRQLLFTMDSSDFAPDYTAAVNEAMRYGKNNSSAFSIYRAYQDALKSEKDIAVTESMVLDTVYIQDTIAAAKAEIDQTAAATTVTPDPDNFLITVVIGQPGRTLDADGLYTAVCDAFRSGVTSISYDYAETDPEPVSIADAYNSMTVQPVNAAYDPETDTITPESGGCLPDHPLEEAQAQVDNAGYGETLLLTFSYIAPDVTAETLEASLFQDTLASYASPYDTSNPGRTENLRLACEAIDGTILQPGEVFSFNDTVGERTEEKGYQTATVYVSGNSVDQLGGGVCQVASTIYYCCMYADLEIVQREPHMYFVTYVPGGLDATVYWGQVDFQFKNSTEYPIRIDAYLENYCCYIGLVGTDTTGNYVEIDSECVDEEPFTTITKDGTGDYVSGYTGYTYKTTRYVYASDGTLIRTDTPDDLGQCGTSEYKKRDRVVYTGIESSYSEPEPETETDWQEPDWQEPDYTEDQGGGESGSGDGSGNGSDGSGDSSDGSGNGAESLPVVY